MSEEWYVYILSTAESVHVNLKGRDPCRLKSRGMDLNFNSLTTNELEWVNLRYVPHTNGKNSQNWERSHYLHSNLILERTNVASNQ